MKNKILLNIIFILTLVFISTAAFAQKAILVDKNYDLGKIDNIYIEQNIDFKDPAKDMNSIYKLKAKEYWQNGEKYLKKINVVSNKEYADAILNMTMEKVDVKHYKYPDTEETVWEKVVVINKEGKETSVSVPKKKVIKGATYFTNYLEIKYELTDKEGNSIFEYMDIREGAKSTAGMLSRSIKDFYQKLDKTIRDAR